MDGKRVALVSVSDKSDILLFCKNLLKWNFDILSTGGTAKLLKDAGIPVQQVSDYTKFPEILSGRVKTLHPRIHGAILGDKRKKEHAEEMISHNLTPIDLVVVNLYPFAEKIEQPACSLEIAIENIDIGGPAMIRAAAKNWENVSVLTNSTQYASVIEELEQQNGQIGRLMRFSLASEAFSHTASYDGMVSNYLSNISLDGKTPEFPDTIHIHLSKRHKLRYGENPHQRACWYEQNYDGLKNSDSVKQLGGKDLSFNNLVDIDTANECVQNLEIPSCVIVKHGNPCGVARGRTPGDAYKKALSTDPTSAFGGIVAFNDVIDGRVAKLVSSLFVEVIIAPDFEKSAIEVFEEKKNIRIIKTKAAEKSSPFELKYHSTGFLLQSRDVNTDYDSKNYNIPTLRKPTDEEKKDLFFAWEVSKFIKSNAIVFCKDKMTIGVGAGQMSRVDSVKIARIKAKEVKLETRGSVVASDAFFPFPDALELIAEAGVTAVIQPGGSVRDQEIIDSANKLKMAMILTGYRHFRH